MSRGRGACTDGSRCRVPSGGGALTWIHSLEEFRDTIHLLTFAEEVSRGEIYNVRRGIKVTLLVGSYKRHYRNAVINVRSKNVK